jgi:hypothetical protein
MLHQMKVFLYFCFLSRTQVIYSQKQIPPNLPFKKGGALFYFGKAKNSSLLRKRRVGEDLLLMLANHITPILLEIMHQLLIIQLIRQHIPALHIGWKMEHRFGGFLI